MFELACYIVAFVILSGVMAAIEAAVLSVSRVEIEELVLKGAWGARRLKAIHHEISRPMVVLVILTNTINILGPILAGRKAIQLYGDIAIAGLTVTLTVATIVLSEIIPKSIGTHYAPLISRWMAPTIQILIWALYPLVVALNWLSNLFKAGKRRFGTEEQIRSLVSMGRRAGYIESNEGQLIRRAFVLNDRTAVDIMTPRDQMVTVAATSTIGEAAEVVFCHAYSRYPVTGSSVDDLRGLVMSRDILQAVAERREQENVTSLCRDCITVQRSVKADELLVRFRDERIHLAVVKHRQHTVGLVTLEDVLEELVGEIEDEKDATPNGQPSADSGVDGNDGRRAQ